MENVVDDFIKSQQKMSKPTSKFNFFVLKGNQMVDVDREK